MSIIFLGEVYYCGLCAGDINPRIAVVECADCTLRLCTTHNEEHCPRCGAVGRIELPVPETVGGENG